MKVLPQKLSLLLILLLASFNVNAELLNMTVYKSPTCGCCGKWIEHLQNNGFKIKVIEEKDVRKVKKKFDIDLKLASCHTAVLGNYIIEGHIPSKVIKRLITEKPDIAGIAVPGMPIGSPGMEGPNPQVYTVYSFDKNGKTSVFATVNPDA